MKKMVSITYRQMLNFTTQARNFKAADMLVDQVWNSTDSPIQHRGVTIQPNTGMIWYWSVDPAKASTKQLVAEHLRSPEFEVIVSPA